MGYTTEILNNTPGWWIKDTDSNNYKFVYSFEDTFDNTVENLEEFKKGWQINYATGTDLDKIAEKYGLVRNQHDTDDSFRAKIKTYLLTFSGSGSVPDIKKILSFLTSLDEDDITIESVRTLVYNILISVDAETDFTILNEVTNTIPTIKAAGVYVLETNYTSANNIFLTNLSKTNNEDKIL